MGELLNNALTITWIVALGCLLVFLIWVAATSKSFVAVSLTGLVAAWVALVLLVSVLFALDRLVWWAALVAVLAGSTATFLALPALTKVGLGRAEAQLKTESPSHWHEGEISGRQSAAKLSVLPKSDEEKRLAGQLVAAAEAAHLEHQAHEAPDAGCEAFQMAFTGAFYKSVRSGSPS